MFNIRYNYYYKNRVPCKNARLMPLRIVYFGRKKI